MKLLLPTYKWMRKILGGRKPRLSESIIERPK